MTEQIEQNNKIDLPPIKLAFILDGEVADVLHTDERLSAIFLSNPKVLDITERTSNGQVINPGYIYDESTDTFSDPLEDEE